MAARVLQAVGAAVLVPTSLGLLLPEFPPERRASATALWGAVGGVAAATGPSLGGLLIEWGDWRLVFFVNLVLGAVGVGAGAAAAARDPRPGPRRGARTRSGSRCSRAASGCVSLAIVEAPDWGWGSASVLAAFAVAAVVLWARSCGARASHPHPVLELSLFRVRSFAVACAGVFVFALGFYAVLLANILFLTSVWGYSTLEAGFAVTPGPLMAALSSALAGRDDRPLRVARGRRAGRAALRARVRAVRDRAGLDAGVPVRVPPGHVADRHRCRAVVRRASARRRSPQLPPARFATGSAISTCFRQLGAVLGISVLIAVAPGLHAGLRADGGDRGGGGR